jgi:hypothetical protein
MSNYVTSYNSVIYLNSVWWCKYVLYISSWPNVIYFVFTLLNQQVQLTLHSSKACPWCPHVAVTMATCRYVVQAWGKIAAFYHACVSACEAGAGTTIFYQDITLIALCSTDRLFELWTQEKTLESVLVDKTRPKQFPAKNRAPAGKE